MSMTVYQRRKQNKKKLLEYLEGEIPKHRGFIIVGITGVEDSLLQIARKTLMGRAKIRVVKNTVLSKALEKISLEEPTKQLLESSISHENAIVFTDDSVFGVASELLKLRRSAYIKPNRAAPFDVVIPAGVTPLQPGPFTDSLNALGVPYEVKKNLVYIKKDTLVVKKGERVNARIAELLRELSIAPLSSAFNLKLAVEDGLYIPGDRLAVDLSAYVADVSRGHADALALSVNLGIPVAEAVPFILARAASQALAVAVEAGYPTQEALPLLLARGISAAKAVSQIVEGKAVTQ